MNVRAWIRLLRVKQYSKNLLVFAAWLFTRGFAGPEATGRVLVAFVAMCLISSSVYILNDYADIERDRNHPTKRSRPLAARLINPHAAIFAAILLGVAGLALGTWLNTSSAVVLLLYLSVQVLYNLFLKRQPIADVFCIATGFVLRAVLGATAIQVTISAWLLFCTGALALLLGFSKRRHEYHLGGEAPLDSRESLREYSPAVLDALVQVSAACAAISYGVYAIDSATAAKYPGLVLTCPFVFYGIYRYLFLVLGKGDGGEPETLLLKDIHLLLAVGLFVAVAALALQGVTLPFLEPVR